MILPWNDTTVAASPFVAAFTQMGIPYADDLMNAVVLTAVLSCLNSGMYTASRMLFVLAARREAPLQLVSVTKRGVPAVAILASSVVGFLCVIAAAVSPDTVFAFLLNSSGAIILFVYVLIGISQIVLRRRSGSEHLRVKMWLFPGLSIFTVAGDRRDPGADGHRAGLAVATGPEPAVLGGRDRVLLRQQVVHRPPPGAAGDGPGPGAAPSAGAGQRDRELRRAARRAAPHRRRPGRPLLRRGARQPRGDRYRGDARPARRDGGHPGAAQARLDHTLSPCARRTCRPTARWGTTGRCGHWPTPSTPSTRIRSSSPPCRSRHPSGTGSTSSTAPARSTPTCR